MDAIYRQKLLWLQPVPTASVTGVETAEMVFKRTLGATILELRASHGLSQQALAQELTDSGAIVSESKVLRWEAGDNVPDAWEINRLASLFDVEPVELIRPKDLTDREIQLLRRVARQGRRSIDQQREAG